MIDKTTDLANKISEVSARLSNDLETLAGLIVDATHNADTRFTDIFNRQTPQLKCTMGLPYSVRSVAQHLRVRTTTVTQLLDVLANVQYIKDLELIENRKRPWRELAAVGQIDRALDELGQYEKLSKQEILAIIGFFSSVGK